MANAREDDPSISGDVRLWRRIPNWLERFKYDEKSKQIRPSSINFHDDANELSVNIAAETSIQKVLEGHKGFGLVEFTAGFSRQLLGSAVILCRDPQPDNPGHALMCGKVSRSKSAQLAKMCHWIVTPESSPEMHAQADPPTPQPYAQRLRRQSFLWDRTLVAALLILVTLAVVLVFYFLSK